MSLSLGRGKGTWRAAALLAIALVLAVVLAWAFRGMVPPADDALGSEARADFGGVAYYSPGARPRVAADDGRTGQGALRRLLPALPGAQAFGPIADREVVNGLPMNLAAYETTRDVASVLEFYAAHFRKNGWSYSGIEETKKSVPYPALSATILEDDLQLSVMVMPHGEGKGNTVVLGLADMRGLLNAPSHADTGDLPIYPGTQPVALRSSDGEVESLTVSLRTGDSPDEVERFYREELTHRGYQAPPVESTPPGAETLRQLRFGSGARIWRLTITRRDNLTAVTAFSSGSGKFAN